MLQYEDMILQDHFYLEVHEYAMEAPILEPERKRVPALEFESFGVLGNLSIRKDMF